MLNSFLFYATMFVVFGPVKFRQSGPKVDRSTFLQLICFRQLKLELEPDVFTLFI